MSQVSNITLALNVFQNETLGHVSARPLHVALLTRITEKRLEFAYEDLGELTQLIDCLLDIIFHHWDKTESFGTKDGSLPTAWKEVQRYVESTCHILLIISKPFTSNGSFPIYQQRRHVQELISSLLVIFGKEPPLHYAVLQDLKICAAKAMNGMVDQAMQKDSEFVVLMEVFRATSVVNALCSSLRQQVQVIIDHDENENGIISAREYAQANFLTVDSTEEECEREQQRTEQASTPVLLVELLGLLARLSSAGKRYERIQQQIFGVILREIIVQDIIDVVLDFSSKLREPWRKEVRLALVISQQLLDYSSFELSRNKVCHTRMELIESYRLNNAAYRLASEANLISIRNLLENIERTNSSLLMKQLRNQLLVVLSCLKIRTLGTFSLHASSLYGEVLDSFLHYEMNKVRREEVEVEAAMVNLKIFLLTNYFLAMFDQGLFDRFSLAESVEKFMDRCVTLMNHPADGHPLGSKARRAAIAAMQVLFITVLRKKRYRSSSKDSTWLHRLVSSSTDLCGKLFKSLQVSLTRPGLCGSQASIGATVSSMLHILQMLCSVGSDAMILQNATCFTDTGLESLLASVIKTPLQPVERCGTILIRLKTSAILCVLPLINANSAFLEYFSERTIVDSVVDHLQTFCKLPHCYDELCCVTLALMEKILPSVDIRCKVVEKMTRYNLLLESLQRFIEKVLNSSGGPELKHYSTLELTNLAMALGILGTLFSLSGEHNVQPWFLHHLRKLVAFETSPTCSKKVDDLELSELQFLYNSQKGIEQQDEKQAVHMVHLKEQRRMAIIIRSWELLHEEQD